MVKISRVVQVDTSNGSREYGGAQTGTIESLGEE